MPNTEDIDRQKGDPQELTDRDREEENLCKRLEETFAQQHEEMEQLYGNSVVPMPPQSPQAHDLLQIGSTRSSISSYSDGLGA